MSIDNVLDRIRKNTSTSSSLLDRIRNEEEEEEEVKTDEEDKGERGSNFLQGFNKQASMKEEEKEVESKNFSNRVEEERYFQTLSPKEQQEYLINKWKQSNEERAKEIEALEEAFYDSLKNPDLTPFSIFPDPKERETIENPTVSQKFLAGSLNFLEGFLFGQNLSNFDEAVQLHPVTEFLTEGAGTIANMLILGAGARTVTNTVAGASWIQKASRGLIKGTDVISRYSPTAGKLAKSSLNVAGKLAKEQLTGRLVALGREGGSPEHLKTGLEGSNYMAAQFTGGELGSIIAEKALKKFFPTAGPGVTTAVRFIGDAIGGPIMAYQHYEDIEGMTKDMFAADVIAIGLLNVITYNVGKGRLQRTPQVDEALKKVDRAYEKFDLNKTEVNQQDVFRTLGELIEIINPEGQTQVLPTLFDNFMKDLDVDIQRVSNSTAQMREYVRTGQVGDNLEAYSQKLLKDGGADVTIERAKFLDQATPAKDGTAINTRRIDSTAENREVTLQMAEMIREPVDSRTHAEILAKADELFKNNDELRRTLPETVEAVEKAPEVLTATRRLVDTQVSNILELATELHKKGDAVTEVELQTFNNVFLDSVDILDQRLRLSSGAALTTNVGALEIDGVKTRRFLDVENQSSVKPKETGTPQTDPIKTKDIIKEIVESDGDILKEVLEGTVKGGKNVKFTTRLANALIELRTSNLLKNIGTSIYNVGSQTLNALEDGFSNYFAGLGTTIFRIEGGKTLSQAHAENMGALRGLVNGIFKPSVSMYELAKTEAVAKGQKVPSPLSFIMRWITDPQSIEDLTEASSFTSKGSVEGFRTRYMSAEYLAPNWYDKPIINLVSSTFDWASSHVRLLGFTGVELTDRPFSESGYNAGLRGELARRTEAGLITKTEAKRLEEQTLAWRTHEATVKYIEQVEKQEGIKLSENVVKDRIRELTEGRLEGLEEVDIQRLEELHSTGLKQSDVMTYKDEIQTDLFRNFEQLRNASPALRWVVPFHHTPIRLMENWWYKSPWSRQLWSDMRGKTLLEDGVTVDRQRQSKAVGQFTTSLGLYALGAILYSERRLTPTARNADERRRMEEAGLPEESIWIAGRWIPISRLDPVSMYLQTIANGMRTVSEMEADDDNDIVDFTGSLVMDTLNNVLNDTWLTNVREFVDVLMSDDEETLGNYFRDQLTTLNPLEAPRRNLTRYDFGGLNPFYEEYRTNFNWTEWEPEIQLDTFGKYKTNYDTVLGFQTHTETDSPIRQELVDLGVSLRRIPRSWGGVDLTDQQRYEVTRYLETHLHAEDYMNSSKVIDNENYRRGNIEVKRGIIQEKWKALTDAALGAVLFGDENYVDNLKTLLEEPPPEQQYQSNWFEEQRRNR